MTTVVNPTTVISSTASSLACLLHDHRLLVPWHQRQYDWDPENVSELLEDLDDAYRQNRSAYFLGTVLLTDRGNSTWEINDGQQRIVTYSMICARLARIFASNVDPLRENRAMRILFDLPENHTTTMDQADRLEPRVTPPLDNTVNYTLVISGKNIGTNGKLTTAWRIIDDYFRPVETDTAQKFFDYITSKLEVVAISAPTSLDPNSVYETLNARGKALEDFDLIRNHIYSFFNNEEEAQRRQTIHSGLEAIRSAIREDKRVKEYTRCLFECEYGYLPNERLYRVVRRHIRKATGNHLTANAVDYVYDLGTRFTSREATAVFKSVAYPTEDDAIITRFIRDSNQTGAPRNAFHFLNDMKHYTVTQPVMFALLHRYVQEPDGQKRKMIAKRSHTYMKMLTSLVFRTALIGPKFEPSQFDSGLSNLAKTIAKTDDITQARFGEVLKSSDKHGVFSDDRFIEELKHKAIKETSKVKRLLLGILQHEQPGRASINERRYSVDPVLPIATQHLDNWGFSPKEHADNVYLIGNQALLSEAENKPGRAFNQSFDRKKAIFETSFIDTTRSIADAPDWNPEAIAARQADIAVQAAKVWDLPHV